MALYAAPGSTVEASAIGFSTGLEGTIGVRVVDVPTDTTVVARFTAGVAEFPAGSGIYAAQFTAPTAAGTYQIVWDNGSGTYAVEDLLVTYTAPASSSPSGVDLVTVTQVREYLDKPTGDTAQDTVIQNLITRASHLILRYSGRDFVLADGGANPRTRPFPVDGYWRTRVIPVGDMAAVPTAVVVQDRDAVTIATLDVSVDLEARPLVRLAWEPITHLYLRSTAPLLDPTYRISVTGTFGFPSVPAEVQQACIVTVGTWLRRDVSAFSQTFALDEARIERPQALPQAAMRMLDPWRHLGAA